MASSRFHPPFRLPLCRWKEEGSTASTSFQCYDPEPSLVCRYLSQPWSRRFIIISGIDCFRRLVTFLINTPRTVLECFLSGVNKYGLPSRVRSDKCLENVSKADFMLSERGEGGMITGACTHNQRIERLWRGVFELVLSYFYNLFYHMADEVWPEGGRPMLESFSNLISDECRYILQKEINHSFEKK